jgi:8-oxo-dGTP pyrophosphatase MutT (NUDIX family)
MDRSRPGSTAGPLDLLLRDYQPTAEDEAAEVAKLAELAWAEADPWSRAAPLHFTASAVIVHPPSGRVLLRWHPRQQAWLQVGGHADPGESDPLAIALREAVEETGLTDLAPWPSAELRHAVIVGVPAGRHEPAHEHADLRFVLATRSPQDARAESQDAPLRWLPAADAVRATAEDNLKETLERVQRLLAAAHAP